MLLQAAFWTSTAALALLTVCLWAALAETLRLRLSPPPPAGPLLPMTLIKPVKGLDDGLAANFESIAAADPGRAVQVIVALESREDPAYGVAAAFAARHPERDILVLETGSPRGRMGKTHNMIEALPRARHPRVIFSDSDVQTTERLLRETSQAFAEGYDAVFAVPRQRRGQGLPGVMLEIALNHGFGLGAALGWRLIGFTHCAGAWMAYTQEALARAGGLESVSHEIADDFALSRRAAKTGARGKLLAEPVPLREAGGTVKETLQHLLKWAVIIRWSLPLAYFCVPVLNIGVHAAIALGCAWALGRHLGLALSLSALAFASRGLVALGHDALVGDGALPLWWYPVLAFQDVGSLVFWTGGFRRSIRWRGTTYRLRRGGRAEVSRDGGHPREHVLS